MLRACQHGRLSSQPLPSSFLVFTPVPLQLLADYPKRNEAFVFREPGQHQNKCKTTSDSARKAKMTVAFSFSTHV